MPVIEAPDDTQLVEVAKPKHLHDIVSETSVEAFPRSEMCELYNRTDSFIPRAPIVLFWWRFRILNNVMAMYVVECMASCVTMTLSWL